MPEVLPNPVDSGRKRILIIEDEVVMAFMLEEMLAVLGYVVVGIAPNLEEAGDQIEHNSFDAAILDVNLRGQKTFALADQLQKKNRPFIFSTGYGTASLPEEYRNCPILQKPYSMSQLGARLEALFEKRLGRR